MLRVQTKSLFTCELNNMDIPATYEQLEQPSRLSLWVGRPLSKKRLLRQAVGAQEVVMNIGSRSTNPFLAALTNPTELERRKGRLSSSYPVVDKTGKRWLDSEAAYKAFKTGDTPHDERVIVGVIAAKLQQHPELVAGIKERGGRAFLERCDHLVGVRGRRWEGRGVESRFIRFLIATYDVARRKGS